MPKQDPFIPRTTARWVNGTLRVVWSGTAGPFYEVGGDSYTRLLVDGRRVDIDEEYTSEKVFTVPRASSAGPALVELVNTTLVDRGSFSSEYPVTYYRANVAEQVVTSKPGQVDASALLDRLPVRKETGARSFASSRFRHWIDADHDRENTRTEVLKAESSTKVTQDRDRRVLLGRWNSVYDGRAVVTASALAVDHLVPLREAWVSGAAAWSAQKRRAYANDLGFGPSLLAVSKSAVRARAGRGPGAYVPPNPTYACGFVRDTIAVKHRWHLSVDPAEKRALATALARDCINPYVTEPGRPRIGALAG